MEEEERKGGGNIEEGGEEKEVEEGIWKKGRSMDRQKVVIERG